jgi:hypothetical protein
MSATISPNPPHVTPLRLGVPQTRGGITIVPLLVAALPQRAYITLDEAMPLGFTIEEIDLHGHVPELLVRNPLTIDVLLYDGEEVVGAKQNRVLEASILVAASTTQKIPVACVEAGRWHDSGADFAPADRVAHPEIRRRKSVDLEHAPLSAGRSQQTVWAEIDERIHESAVHAPTSALSDVHDAERPRIDGIAESFTLVEGQCGAILALGDVLCLDLVSRPEVWVQLWPKLRRGYLLDGVRHLHDEPTSRHHRRRARVQGSARTCASTVRRCRAPASSSTARRSSCRPTRVTTTSAITARRASRAPAAGTADRSHLHGRDAYDPGHAGPPRRTRPTRPE